VLLLGHVHRAHAAFAQQLQKFVGADAGAGGFGRRWPLTPDPSLRRRQRGGKGSLIPGL
jgi:hypothetical protein